MRKLSIALVCCLGAITTTYAETDKSVPPEANMNTAAPTAASKPPESSVRPQTYMHPSDSSGSTVDSTGPKAMGAKPETKEMSAMSSSDCYITVRNDGITDVNVYGRFDDGVYLTTYTLPWLGDYISYVSLYYNGYCHGSMEFYIDTTSGTYKYNGYTPVGKTVRVK